LKFDKTNRVIIGTLDKVKAEAFIMFLQSEIARHEDDIKNAYDLIRKVARKFDIELFDDE